MVLGSVSVKGLLGNDCRSSVLVVDGVNKLKKKEISESHACYEDPHAHVGQNRSEKDIIPKNRCTRGNIVNRARTIRPQRVIVMVV
jgi:hypothetical protein